MENKIKSYILALLALSMPSLFADDLKTTKFVAKEGGVVLDAAAIQSATPNDPGLVGADDAQSIQNAVDAAAKSGEGVVTIPTMNVRTGRAGWVIARSILLPSGITVYIDDARLTLADDVYANFFRSANAWTTKGRTEAGELRQIRVIGRGNAVLDGAKANDLSEKTSCKDGRPHVRMNCPVLFVNVRDFEVSGLRIENHRYWGACFEHCRYGRIANLRFVARYDRRNQDGINLRNGCSEIDIENISGQTGDDMIALSAIDVNRNPDYSTAVLGRAPDISHVRIRNVRGAAVGHPLVALRNANGAKIYDVTIEGVSDVPFAEPGLEQSRPRYAIMRIGNGIYWSMRPSLPGEMSDITVRDVDCRYSVCGVIVNGNLRNGLFENLRCSGECESLFTTSGPFWGGSGADLENVTLRDSSISPGKDGAKLFDGSASPQCGDCSFRNVRILNCVDGAELVSCKTVDFEASGRRVPVARAVNLRSNYTAVELAAGADEGELEVEPFRMEGKEAEVTWSLRNPPEQIEFDFAPDAGGKPGEWRGYRRLQHYDVVRAANEGPWIRYRVRFGVGTRLSGVKIGTVRHVRWRIDGICPVSLSTPMAAGSITCDWR